MIEYRDNCKGLTVENLNGFFVGWPKPPSKETILKILSQSSHIVLAVDSVSGNLVGFINAVSDNVLSAYLPLLEVLPEYQKQGIGRELVSRMLEKLKSLYMIDLVCDDSLVPYYEKLGLAPMRAMSIRNFDHQNGL